MRMCLNRSIMGADTANSPITIPVAPLSELERDALHTQTSASSHTIFLMFVQKGSLTIVMPEQGKKHVSSGYWCILSDLGARSRFHFSEEAFLRIFALNMQSIDAWVSEGYSLSPRLSCLSCKQRSAGFFLQGQMKSRMHTILAGDASHSQNLSTLEALCAQQARLWELFTSVLQCPEMQALPNCRPCFSKDDEETFEKVARYLEAHYAQSHSLPELARRFHVNEFKLKKGFKAVHGTTVFEYLKTVRMQNALNLLNTSNATVLSVANAVGYSNPSHFARAFRQVHGMNPSEAIFR